MSTYMRVCVVAAFAAGCACGATSGATYTTQAAFLAAVQSPRLSEDFTGMGHPGPTLTLAQNGYGVQFTTGAQALLVFDLSGNNYLTTSNSTSGFSAPITLTFTTGNVTAVGGSFFQTSGFGAFLSSPVTLSFSDGTSQVLTPSSNADFFGYTSTVPIASLTVSPDASHHFVSMDNIRIGAAIVPAPGAAVFLACAGMLGARRRRGHEGVGQTAKLGGE